MQSVMRNRLKPFGTAREKCIAMLENLGVNVSSCYPAVGHWRSSPYADVYRWEFTGTYRAISICGGCWQTMTACAKAGRLYLDEDAVEVSTFAPQPPDPICIECGECRTNMRHTDEPCCKSERIP